MLDCYEEFQGRHQDNDCSDSGIFDCFEYTMLLDICTTTCSKN